MGSTSVPLDELEQQSSPQASSVPLDELETQSQPHDFTQEALSGKLAPVTGKPSEPKGQPYIDRAGMEHETEAVPEAAGWKDPLIHIAAGAEPIATGLSRIKENSAPPVSPEMPMARSRGGPATLPQAPHTPEQQARDRQTMLGGAEVLQGTSQLATVAAPAAVAAAPVKVGLGFGAGYLASEGVGKAVHGHVSPEAEELTRQVAFFVPSAAGMVSGLKTTSVETPGGEAKFSGVEALGGKVKAAYTRTPEFFRAGAKIGNTQVEANIPRNAPAPVPEPSEAAKALASFEQHTGNPDFQPAPPPPAPPGANGPEHLTPDVVKGVSDAIMQAPAAKRPGLMTEAHGNMVKWMVGRGTFVGPDGKIHTVDSEGQAKKLASKFINDEVDRRDAEQDKTAKAVAATQAPTTTAPIAGKPPAAGNMTTDTAAVKKVAAEANIHPEQKPAIAVKKEPPKEAAALAKPPEPVKPQDVAAIGKEDKESGRTILQPSDDVMQNERLAAAAAPELATKLSHIAAGVEGATFDRLRPQKELERVDEKVDDAGKPPETVPDYLAAQIAADTPQAKDKLIAALHKNFNVVNVEDNFLEGKPELANYRSANVQVMLSPGNTAEVQIVPRELQEIANQSHVYYTAGREADLRGDHAERDKQFAKAAEMHDSAMEKFNKRNRIEPKPKHEFASTQINIDPQSELGQAHAQAVAAIPKEHVGKEGLEKTPHVTIRYGLKDDSPASVEKIKQAAAEIEPFDVPVGKTDVFPATEHSSYDHPVIARLETTPELKALRKAVEGAGAFKEDNFPEYKPHITLGYIKPEFAQRYKGGNQLEGKTVPVKEVTVSKRDGSQEVIPLGGQRPHSVPLDELEGLQAPTPKPVQASLGEEAPVVPQESQPERRTAEHRVSVERKNIDEMSDAEKKREIEELRQERTTSELTGLPNKKAFYEDSVKMAESHPQVGFADVDGFKETNTILGEDAVDAKVLPVIGEAFNRAISREPAGSIKVYHRSGDEFWFRSKDKAAITRVVERVNEELKNAVFTAEAPDGTIHEKIGAGLSHGTGTDTKSAEHDEKYGTHSGSKKQRKEAGLRSGARDIPEPVGGKSTEGLEADRVQERVNDQARSNGREDEGLPDRTRSVPIEELEKSPTPGSPEYEALRKKLELLSPRKPVETPGRALAVRHGQRVADRLRTVADGLDKQIEDKQRPMTQNPTPKRMREYRSRLHDGDNMKRVQAAMRALADAHEQGNVPNGLEELRTKDEIYRLVYKGVEGGGGYYDVIPSQHYANKTPQGKALQELMERHKNEPTEAKEAREKASKISQLEADVQFQKLPGYFPTPKPVVEKMLDLADIQPGDKVLEPSAGKGNIADLIREREPEAHLSTIETQSKLRQILELKGHKLADLDFLGHDGKYDKIVMNPPFENGQDIDHVQRAFTLLNPGGKLVAIMSESPFFRSDRKGQAFREWLEEHGGTSEKLEPGSFKESGTGVNARMVEIEKPKAKTVDNASPQESKAPWQMTRDEYARENWQSLLQRFRNRPDILDSKNKTEEIEHFKQLHVNAVAQALQQGKQVPAEVLKDYPGLQKQAEPISTAKQEQTRTTRPQIQGENGKTAQLLTPSGSQEVRYRLVEAGSLIPSHNPLAFAKNEAYPEGVQERTYHSSKEAQNRVIQQAQNYEPAYTVNNNPDAVNGPPVITPDGIVLGGNSRAMSTMRYYKDGAPKYREALMQAAPQFGFTKEQVDALKQPVLVRELTKPPSSIEELRRIGSDLNKSMTGALGVNERAASAGKSITPATLSEISRMVNEGGEGATLRDVMRQNGQAIVRMMVQDGVITDRERPQFVDTSTGGLSDEGKTFVERALMGSVVDEPDLMDRAPKSVLAKLEGSLADIASLASRTDEYNVLPILRQALEDHAEIAQSGSTVEDHLAQTGMFAPERNPAVDAMVRTLAKKPREFREAMKSFAADANHDVQGQGSLGFGEKPSASGAFNAAFGSDLSEDQFTDAVLQSLEKGGTIGGEKQDVGREEKAPPAVIGSVQRHASTSEATGRPAGSTEARPAEKTEVAPRQPVKGKQSPFSLSANELPKYFTPGKIIAYPGNLRDKVIAFHPADPEAGYPKNHWSVDVISVDAKGEPLPNERVRNHATMPDRREIAEFRREQTTGFESGSMRASAFGVDILAKQAGEFYKQDVAPAVKGAAGGLKEVVTKGLRLVAPRVGVPSHLLDTIMKMKGQREEEMYRFQRTTEGMKKMFDKLPKEARIAFIDRMMHGQRQPSTELEDVADSIRAIQDRFREQEKVFKPDLTDKENYFHLKWTKLPQGVDEDGNLIEGTGGERPNTGQGNRPLQGGRSFMKRKTLPDASAGISRGGELLTTNPIGLLEHRVQESLKFTTARKMWEELKDTPYTVSERGRPMHMVQFFREGQGQQARALGYEQLNDRIAKVLFPAGSGEGMVRPGEYWVEQNAARLLNNFLSRDLIRESAAGRGIVGLKNATTAWRLAFSPFHALTESIITTGSEIGRGIEHSFNQGLRQGSPAEIGKGVGIAAKAPVAPFTAAREGGSAIRYVTSPEEFLATTRGQKFIKQYPEAAELISDLFTGGAKLAMHEDYRMKMVESMRRAIADNNYIGAVLRTPGAVSQAIQYPLFETYIPRLKLGMFLREYSEALADRKPELEAGKLTRAKLARETWDNIDYRFGEVNWDNFFFNRTFKTSLQLAFRAFAWRFGNFAFTGSAVTGQGRQVAESLKFLKDAATGGDSARPGTNAIPKLDPRMAKLLGLAIFGLIAHGMLQWALTREKPKDVKDLIAPRDGTLDAHGHPNRWTLPIVPYRDLESAKANPGGYLRGGTADIWTAIPEAINNRDFRNHLISHPSDPYWEQMFDKAAHVVGTPIGFERYRQEKKRGEGTGNALLGEAGLSRATNYELTPAEKKMREIQIAHYGKETDEDLEAREKKDERIAAGHLTPKEMQDKVRNSLKNNFERGMKSFTYEQAKQVYDVATPEEKAMIGIMLLKKRFNSRRTAASGQ